MSEIHIAHSFDYAGGQMVVDLRQNHAEVTYLPGGKVDGAVTIEDSFGEITDWHKLYDKWGALHGAALEASEKRYAQEYAEAALGQWIAFTAQRMSELEE